MSTHTVHRSRVVPAHSAPEFGRRTLTLIGAAALIVGACLNWTQNTLGTNLTFRSLLQEDFATRADVVRTSGGIAILLGIVALVGLVDRKAWLSRLAGLAAIAEFVMLAIEVYRGSGRTLQIGAWLLLAGGVVLLLGGSVHERNRYIETPAGGAAVDDGVDDTATRPATRRVPDREPVATPESDAERTQVVNAPVDPSAEGRDF
jgi:hypothetical protein